MRNSTKHVQDEVRTAEMVEPILEIYEAACGAPLTERPYFSVTNCTIAPLQHDREMTEAGLKLVRPRGADLRAPDAAGRHDRSDDPARHLHPEHGRAALRHRAVPAGAPRLRLISGVGSAVADMRSGGYIASSPEIGLINLICLEMSRFYGLPTQATGMSADAKAADFQAGSEGGMTALIAALAGADSLISAGGLDGVQVSSLAKYVLDNDQVGALRRYLREDTIDETTALMDDILDVGIGGHFLGRKSTRAYSRSEGVAAAGVPARHLRGVRRPAAGTRGRRPGSGDPRDARSPAAARGCRPAHRRGHHRWAARSGLSA